MTSLAANPASPQSTRHSWWAHRHLLRQYFLRSLREETQGSLLGPVWLLLQPLMMMALYTFVFGVLLERRATADLSAHAALSYALGIWIGLTLLNAVNEPLRRSADVLVGNRHLVKKVVFPLAWLPVNQVLLQWVTVLLSLLLAWAALPALGAAWSFEALALIPIGLALSLWALGLCWGVAALTVYLRDLPQLTQLLTQILFWMSGIFYTAADVQRYPAAWAVLRWNPVLRAIEEARAALLWEERVDWAIVGCIGLAGLCVAAAGYGLFRLLQPGFADVL